MANRSRSDIKNADIQRLWNEGKTMNAISRELNCGVGLVRSRLVKLGVKDSSMNHSAGCQRHYDDEAEKMWSQIKADFDAGMTMTPMVAKYHMTRERFRRLFDKHGYDYESVQAACKAKVDEAYRKQLSDLRDAGKTVKEIGAIIGKSESMTRADLQKFGLTKMPDRIDISDAQIMDLWNTGISIHQIAIQCGCSHDTVTKRLAKHGISCDRKTGIERHFDAIHGQHWDEIKVDLDANIPVSEVAQRYNMRYEAVYRMMEAHSYQYPNLKRLDEQLLKDRLTACNDTDEHRYLCAIQQYFVGYGHLPVVYTLARAMNRPMFDVRTAVTKYKLYDFIGNDCPSMKVQRVLNDLTDRHIRYELNNRSILRTDHETFMEIDVYMPDLNLGLEINPTWTHSVDSGEYGQPNHMYHQNKSLLAESNDVGLIHMFDGDFLDNRVYECLLNQLSARNGAIHHMKIGARHCAVNLINRSESNAFLNKYHFQGGENNSSVQYGLFYNDILVGVLTVGTARYTDDDYEIIRYCMHPGYRISGCFGKLFHAFCKSLTDDAVIVSYMDLNKRFTASNVYDRNGFEYDGLTPPDYVWYNRSGTDMKSRYSVTKHQLVRRGFDETKSEIEIMKSQGYYRVYGAGSKRYKYHYVAR